jgi:dCTP deaminase
MILSNVEIQRAIDEGRLRITPDPIRTPTVDSPSSMYNSSSVDLRLAEHISILGGGPFTFDLSSGGLAGFLTQNSTHVSMDPAGGYTLAPHRFILGQTLERIELPIQPDGRGLSARIEGRSSFARCGLLVHFTAPTVHAGFAGTLTLEMINLGPASITLKPGMRICQLILEEVLGVPFENFSQFQDQNTPAGEPRRTH